jgi:hypothetical protein
MKQKHGEANIKAYGNNFTTMTPGPFAKWMRQNLIFQIIRFVIINIKMIIVVRKSH